MTTKTFPYSHDSLQLVYQLLSHYKEQGKPREYEIRIDDLSVVPRTSNLGLFHSFKKALTEYSTSVCILLFQGNSRKSDKYVLERKGKVSPDPNTTTQTYIQEQVRKRLEENRQQLELEHLRSENKRLSKRIKQLKKKISELEEIRLNTVKELIQMATLHLGNFKPGDKDLPKAINGVPTEDILKMMDEKRQEMGDEMFGKCLSILLMLAMNPEFIPAVEEVAKELEKKANESKTKEK